MAGSSDADCEMVAKFLLSTYRLQPTKHDVWAISESAIVHCMEISETGVLVPLISGSSAEFYIKPMLPCVDDIDIMYHWSTNLAIPAGYPAPTELPAEFHGRVEVWEIIDSQYTGYVYLKRRYILTECNGGGRGYNAVLDHRTGRMTIDRSSPSLNMHGPAETIPAYEWSSLPAVDRVQCVRCLSWPTQAADWPIRHRNYDWPDSATVDRVVSNGCDVVCVQHPRCREDDWESKRQWRLSFSRAEVVLLNSWTPVQQIVYHMLRIFLKAKRLRDITDESGTRVFSNYQVKTLMLWACELNPGTWWVENTNVIRVCVELLHLLAHWLPNAFCPHYFISNCNLLENTVIIAVQLKTETDASLATWFECNYLNKCVQMYADDDDFPKLESFEAVVRKLVLDNVITWRRNEALLDLWHVYVHAAHTYLENMLHYAKNMHSCVYFIEELAKLNLQTTDWFAAITFLRIAMNCMKQDLDMESADVLSVLCEQSISRRRYSSQPGSVLLLSQAAKLMKVVANNSRSTMQLIEIELSKAYLYRALRCKDSDNDSVYCLANVYLAVLYYTTGQYQTAIDHCTLVMRSQDHSQCSSHVVQGELLPKIDDDIDNVLGLVVFYQYVRTAALNQQQQAQHASVFTTELFAYSLDVRCMSFTTKSCHAMVETLPRDVIRQHRMSIRDKPELFIDDLLLYILFTRQSTVHFQSKSPICHRQRPATNPAEFDASDLVELLHKSAVERLTKFRHVESEEFGSELMIVTTDFEAMYAYKRGDYQLCLQVCGQNVHTLLYRGLCTCIFTHPEFLQLLDHDIVSLTALTLLIHPKCRGDRRFACIKQLTLSLYLMTQCQLKLRHSATELAQTLDYVERAEELSPAAFALDHMTLQLTRKLCTMRHSRRFH